ncbi:MAG: hypothetical protein ACI9ND_002044 [Yoonia sp.]|jgi:hypothetical protein
MREKHRMDRRVDAAEWPGTCSRAEQDHPMATGTKTFLVMAFMAIAAFCGSIGMSSATPIFDTSIADHVD